jgi:hypothetical protein
MGTDHGFGSNRNRQWSDFNRTCGLTLIVQAIGAPLQLQRDSPTRKPRPIRAKLAVQHVQQLGPNLEPSSQRPRKPQVKLWKRVPVPGLPRCLVPRDWSPGQVRKPHTATDRGRKRSGQRATQRIRSATKKRSPRRLVASPEPFGSNLASSPGRCFHRCKRPWHRERVSR